LFDTQIPVNVVRLLQFEQKCVFQRANETATEAVIMNKTWMIYGANGYTGQLAARLAHELGESPILAGRNAEQIEPLASELGLETCVFDLHDPDKVARNLEGVAAVLHCAGPFSATSRPMLDACIKSGTHYLDITGEIEVFESIFARDAELRRANIVAIPGVGMDVTPTDCLAAMLKRELPSATHLKLAVNWRNAKISPGTAKTMAEGIPSGGKVRLDGKIVTVPPAWKLETFSFSESESLPAVTIPWGDVATAYYSTGIPNIEVYAAVSEKQIKQMRMPAMVRWLIGLKPVQNVIKKQIGKRVKGPDTGERAGSEVQIYGEVSDAAGNRKELRLRTVEGYTLTAESAVKAAIRVAAGEVPAGAHTPSMAFGADYILGLDGTRLS
jgi:short subunit dehydrogenase-like uncharacterized protein